MAEENDSGEAGRGSKRIRSDFYFTNLFRVLQACVYAALAYSTLALGWIEPAQPVLARAMAITYLLFAAGIFLSRHRWLPRVTSLLPFLVVIDVVAATLAIIALHDSRTGIAMMLVINIAGAALMLPLRTSLGLAALATLGMLGHTFFDPRHALDVDRELLESALFGMAYFAAAALCGTMARQIRASEELATRRGVDLANMAQVNELIIRRMHTGILLVDPDNRIHQFNESAWRLLGEPSTEERDLGSVAHELARRLYHWRSTGRVSEASVALAKGVPEIVPRFTRLSVDDDSNVLIFLDDTSLVSRRAEELTLSSLGRLSASIAHEIRNPLAAIRYSAQLLAESDELPDGDQRMVEIINNHCSRLNEIIENILQLSRRERTRPESIDLADWARNFVEEYIAANEMGEASLRVVARSDTIAAVADAQQLQQVVWNLVQNALRYGRMPNTQARVALVVRHDQRQAPLLEVTDRGPGIPHKVAGQIFEPFFTTHDLGTGLGLYLAREMCAANQAKLEYVPVAGGGSCFRISMTPPARLATSA